MSSIASKTLTAAPDASGWFADLLGVPLPAEGQSVDVQGRTLTMRDGILRAREFVSAAQNQTSDTFGFKWAKRETFEGEPLKFLRQWLIDKYGNIAEAPWLFAAGENPVLLDAGCGAAMSALALFEPVLDRIRYVGVDISTAVDMAKARFKERGLVGTFIQADLNRLPLPSNAVDVIFSEGVLHHTDDTRAALGAVVRHLKPGGRILFYVYRRKGPIREFTDDYVRAKLQAMTPEQGWEVMLPLSKLGKVLGELDIEIDVPENIELLDIPAGRINLQRFFYWHVLKAFYRLEMSIEEMNHINFDWYAPKNAHRQSVDEVRAWCVALGLAIEHEKVEEAGITMIARKVDDTCAA
jgi:SAM-dependent methyltransferase